jgi:hypothetical protein
LDIRNIEAEWTCGVDDGREIAELDYFVERVFFRNVLHDNHVEFILRRVRMLQFDFCCLFFRPDGCDN